MSQDELTKLEQEALEMIEEEGGVPQSQLWKRLDCSAGKGSSIARSLEDKGHIYRERTAFEGNSTYALRPEAMDIKEMDFSLLLAGDLMSPFVEDKDVDVEDEKFTEWIISLKSEYK